MMASKPLKVMLLIPINREKLLRRLDKSRGIKSVKDSILHCRACHRSCYI
jgi:hypothetical protein